MLVYRTRDGLAREVSAGLELLDLDDDDLGALLVRTGGRGEALAEVRAARVRRVVPPAEVELLPPVDLHDDIILVGANYPDHVAEADLATPDQPLFLRVPSTGTAGPRSPLVLPAGARDHVDFEGELAVVVAHGGSDIAVSEAWDHVAGFTVANDFSARDVQVAGITDGRVSDPGAVARAKSFPTFKPLGPAVLLVESLAAQPRLTIETWVNGERRQRGNTQDMLFSLAEIISYVSRHQPLRAGDVILTGTPSGVAFVDGRYLRPDDVVETRIETIGSLTNRVTT